MASTSSNHHAQQSAKRQKTLEEVAFDVIPAGREQMESVEAGAVASETSTTSTDIPESWQSTGLPLPGVTSTTQSGAAAQLQESIRASPVGRVPYEVICDVTPTIREDQCRKVVEEGSAGIDAQNRSASKASTFSKASSGWWRTRSKRRFGTGGFMRRLFPKQEIAQNALDRDPSLVMSAERTLFSSFNQGMLLTVGGIGFMSVGEDDPKGFGAFLTVAGGLWVAISFGMHTYRIRRLAKGLQFVRHDSLIYTGILAALIVVSIGLEVYWGFEFPYLKRSKMVDISNEGSVTFV